MNTLQNLSYSHLQKSIIRIRYCHIKFSTIPPPKNPEKHPYKSTEEFFGKAEDHLKEGDYAQASEKLFGVFLFALRNYVDNMAKEKGVKIKPELWNYYNYEKTCVFMDDLREQQKKDRILKTAFRDAKNHFHVSGWKLNQLNFKDVEEGIKDTRYHVEKIEQLPMDQTLFEQIKEQLYPSETNVDSVVEKIREFIEKDNKRQATIVWLQRKDPNVTEIRELYAQKYRGDLNEILLRTLNF